MNDMLQTLFHLPAFRRSTLLFPLTDSEISKTKITFNFLKLFIQLQLSATALSTNELAISFGWIKRILLFSIIVDNFVLLY
jgi:hypothetical protein